MREDDPAAPTAGRAARRAICGLALPTQFTRLRRKMDAAVPQTSTRKRKSANISHPDCPRRKVPSTNGSMNCYMFCVETSHPPGGRWRRRRDCWIERGISARQKITN
jgi:hypothetical protein